MDNFLGHTIAPEIKKGLVLVAKLKPEQYRPIITAVVEYLERNEEAEEERDGEILAGLQKSTKIRNPAHVAHVFTAILLILRAAVRLDITAPVFKRDLEEISCPATLVTDLARVVKNSREALRACALESRVRLEHVESVRWRVDVSISNSQIRKVLQPFVTLELGLSNGEDVTVTMDAARFKALRYDVAHMLSIAENVEENPSYARIANK